MLEKLIEILMNSPKTPNEIKELLDIKKEKILEKYLENVKKICKRKGWKFIISPAECKKCGFVFKKDVRIPSKCPKCKSYWISKPKFYIKQ